MRTRWIAAVTLTGLLGGALVLSTDAGAADGGIDPADFSSPQPNTYFPLVPGTVSHYRGEERGERFRERVVVTDRTHEVVGVATTVVVDVLRVDGFLAERTEDWYANAKDGTVWYFGEDTAEYDRHGDVISTEGSWEAGVKGAEAGVIMPADPQPQLAYRQEYFVGHAEDQAWVVQRHAAITVPFGPVDQVVRTLEWSRLEPAVVVAKFYAPGLGIVRERVLAGGAERLELVDVSSE